MTHLLDYKNILAVAVLLAVFAALTIALQEPREALGSVPVGSQYQSTTTPAVADMWNLCPHRWRSIGGVDTATSSTGILGSVNVLTTGAGTLTIYDASTTDATKRAASDATSSIRIADFPASPTVGSYHFDVEFKRGLLVDYTTTGTGVASTTISYRCEG